MNPMLAAAIGSVARFVLALGAGYLVRGGVWSQSDAALYVEAATLAAISLGWSWWQKYHGRRKLVVALNLPPTSEAAVEQKIASGAPLPSVTSPTHVVPTVSD